MRRKATIFFLLVFSWVSFGFSSPLKIQEIPRIMERFLNFHIANHELNPTLVQRSIRLYFEQFDPEKVYLLESEVLPYLNMSKEKTQEILQRLQKGDYRDFAKLNRIIQHAILRAQKQRNEIANTIILNDLDVSEIPRGVFVQYGATEKELAQRQKSRMARFYLFHKNRTHLETPERRGRVYSLFEKKVRRMEYLYLFVDRKGAALSKERIEHLFSLRILKAFAKSLDTHTAFFSHEEAYEMRLSLEKQFEGVGVVLSEGVDGVMIAELIPGSPAMQSGKVQINDLLVEVDGQPIENMAFEEVLELLKKKDRNEIILGFKRPSQEAILRVPLMKRPIVMQEDRIRMSSEKFGNGIIGKIALYSFYETSGGHSSEKDIKEAIRKFQQQGELLGLVLDLRENSGGFLSQAIKVAGLFVSNGVIAISKYSQGNVHYLRNIVGKSFFSGPLIILTSKMSASASEIVAQALQDYGVAVIVGDERTFGKGSIQYQTVTDEKADLFFKVTVGRYYTPSGKSTQIDGVIADIVVPTQYAPYNIGERYLEYPLPPDRVEPAFVDPLTDLDAKVRRLFQLRYLPYLQRVVSFWKKVLPILRKNSAYRIAQDPDFQAFLKRQEKIRKRQNVFSVNTIDEPIQISMEDFQMIEAVNILKDMVLIEAESRKSPASPLSPTGT